MKKIFFTLLISLCLLPVVKAEEVTTIEAQLVDYIPFKNLSSFTGCYDNSNCHVKTNMQDLYLYNDFNTFYSDAKNKSIFDRLYLELLDKYETLKDEFPYYYISVAIFSTSSSSFRLNLLTVRLTYTTTNDYYAEKYTLYNTYWLGNYLGIVKSYYDGGFDSNFTKFNVYALMTSGFPMEVGTGDFASTWFYTPLTYFQSNFDYVLKNTTTVFKAYDRESNLIFDITSGDTVPSYYGSQPLVDYTTINLDDYEYVILSLKDYSQTEAFSSTLKVKGMVGITPVYEFGTVEKTNVTDRCNASYSDFTDYGLYVLKSDLTNNAVYYVKSCEDGSAFKFDNTMFDITYVTEENKDNIVLSVNGNNYTAIPFDKLGTTANSNEENNFVPGANVQFDPFASVVDYISSFWEALTTFMGLVTKFFNTLPIEIRAISITAFTTALTLGVIKFIKS